MIRTRLVIGFSMAAVSALAVAGTRDARACGGCFVPPTPPTQTASDITDERMLLSVSSTQSTLYDQIRYAGSPSSFAWVLPIHGIVDVGLSADVLFDSIDALTETTIVAPIPNCPPPPNCGYGLAGTTAGSGASVGGAAAPTVTVTKQENVGPYATVQLHATNSSALDNWLAQNGFVIPANVVSTINQYVTEGFDFLAMKLLPNQGVQSMRPVRVTTPGGSLSLPLRMAAVGTGNSVGITIWVVSDGRYEPQNFPFFFIDESQIIWDYATSSSNYTTLRARNEAALGGAGWEIESSLALNQQLITNVILSGGQYYSGFGYGSPGGPVSGPTSAVDATQDYLAVGSPDAGADSGTPYQSAEVVRAADIATLFAGLSGSNVRVTRFRGDIAHAAMNKDLVLQASAVQAEISNIRTVTRSVNLVCPTYPPCPSAAGSTSGGVSSSSGLLGGLFGGGSQTGTSSASAGASSGSPAGGSPVAVVNMNGGGDGGCSTSSRPRGAWATVLAAMLAVLGLFGLRLSGQRRRR